MIVIGIILYTLQLIQTAHASFGDNSPYYQKCKEKCLLLNCTEDGLNFLNEYIPQPAYLKALLWHCEDECKYECMWKTTEAFDRRNWRTPQFHGKWPFIRVYGVQEPASVLFSLLNMYAHYTMFKRFKKSVRSDAPYYWLWLSFSAVCINAWIWSTIFHARDLPFTEFMDYTCAFSIILMSCYCMSIRLLPVTRFYKLVITASFLAFFVNHVAYLSYGGFDYGYNMKVNIIFATINVIFWFAWSMWNRRRQPYLWKCAAFFSLTAFSTILEIFDFPPILWTFDSHALWHLSTAIICPLLYSFIIDDCTHLRKQEFLDKSA
ncbi:Post-GPI attachment to proteins 3 [Carabus blaptoides fortunei]